MGKSSKKSGTKVDSAAVVAKPSPKSLKKGRPEAEEAIEKKSVSNKKQKLEAKKIQVIPEKEESSSEEEAEEIDSEADSEVDSEVESDEDVAAAEIKTKKSKADSDSASSRTLYIGNLPYSAEKSDIEKFFKSAGEVEEIRLAIKDGKFMGFGHVKFATEEAAEKALAELNGRDLLDRAVRLEMEKERKSKDVIQKGEKSQGQTVFIRGFGKNDSEDQIRRNLEKHFGSCGEITRVAIPKDPMGGVKGIAYIDFKESDSCAGALELSGSELGGETLYVDQAKPRSDSGGGRGGGRGRGRGGRGGDRGGRGRGRGGDRGGRFGGGGGRGRGRRN